MVCTLINNNVVAKHQCSLGSYYTRSKDVLITIFMVLDVERACVQSVTKWLVLRDVFVCISQCCKSLSNRRD